MNENQYALNTIILQIWSAVHGGGVDYIQVFTTAAAGIWLIMMIVNLWGEAISMAAGNQTQLPKMLSIYAVLGMIIWNWPWLADHLYSGSVASLNFFMNKSNTFLGNVSLAFERMQELDIAATTQQSGVMIADPITSAVISGLAVVVGSLALIACYLLTIIMVASSFTILALYLVMGPLFIALGVNENFRQFTFKWIGAVLSYLVVIPLYGAALDICNVIFGASLPNWTNIVGTPSIDHMFIMLFGPLISIGLIFAVSRVAHELTGGVGHSAGSMAASIGMMAAAAAAKIGGAAATGGAGAAAGGGASAGGGAASAASSGGGRGSGAVRAATEG